jgi:hypothetical protein
MSIASEEAAGYPAELLPFGVVLDGYDAEQMVRRRETVSDGSQEATIQEMMCDPLIRYVMVRDATAGCFDLRVEKDNSRSLRDDKQRKDNSRSPTDDKHKVRVERSEES